jgi:hypothetical protein
MSNSNLYGINEQLHLGIEAAQNGAGRAARRHLSVVLSQDPYNVPARMWLAFVMPSPQDTIQLLRQVLMLEADNERARAGLRWAKGRLGLDPNEPDPVELDMATQPKPAVGMASPFPTYPDFGTVKRQRPVLSQEWSQRARQTKRRSIRPMLLIIFITGVIGLTSIGLAALALVPSDVLAAWLPAVEQGLAGPRTAPGEQTISAAQPVEAPPAVIGQGFLSLSDTLSQEALDLAGSGMSPIESPDIPQEIVQSPEIVDFLPQISEPEAASEAMLTSLDPSALIGPELLMTEAAGLDQADLDQTDIDRFENVLLAHQPAYPGEKWIEVNLTTQQVTAWEGDQPVFSFIASTGLPNTPTIQGKYYIYWKLESALMTGPGYYLPEVPYTMYFYAGYALHGTYWHDSFGQPMSHGCVNLETGNAKTLFEWADPVMSPGQTEVVAAPDNPGTLVAVHD